MTTEIIVNAHCGEDKEVKIEIKDTAFVHGPEVTILQDGESSNSLYVYDDREISVKEVKKQE
jgi:hypothetical protein